MTVEQRPERPTNRVGSTLRRAPLLALVAALVVAALIAGAVVRLRPDPGPLEPPLSAATVRTGTVVGQAWTAPAILLPPLGGSETAVFDAVEVVGLTGPVTILGYRVVQPSLGGPIGLERGFPAVGLEAARVAGARYAPGTAPPEIVVGVKATAEGRASIAGFRLRYHIGDRRYVASFARAVVLCAPSC
jgi:hypothetical protein